MSKDINEIQNEIIEDFSDLKDYFDKYEYIIKLGKSLVPIDEKYKSEEHSINGCQSQVWLKAELIDDKIQYLADSDSMMNRGIIFLLLRILNDQNPDDVLNADLYFLDEIGFKSNLSPTRVNGLMTIIENIKKITKDISNLD